MRVLALTKYGTEAASTRQRLMQFAPHLAAHGIEIVARPLLDDAYVRALAHGRRSSRLAIVASYLKRIGLVATARSFDLVWVHFEAFPWGPGALERLLALSGRPVVVDFDDAIFHMYDRHRSPLVRRLLGDKLRPLLARASGVTVGNDYLRRYVAPINPAVTVIPTVVDTDRYVPAPRPDGGRPVVGWIGSPSTWKYVEAVLPVILPVVAEAGAVFRAVGAGPAARAWAGVESVDWREDREIADVQGMDVGIMPLPDEDWARGKCGYKLIQYMACGLPTIASPVGVNGEIVADGATGILAADAEAWRASLSRLLADPALQRRMGEAGRARAVERYSLASQQDRLLGALLDAAGKRPRR